MNVHLVGSIGLDTVDEVFRTVGELLGPYLRRGPDGWWYLIAGNKAGVSADYASLESSPVKAPHAGAILRLSPDLKKGEILAHGFRNAYDFDFGALGDMFTFDSDGEREISLPWYQPTRAYHVLPGSHAGWITENWKRPSTFCDMPPWTRTRLCASRS